MTLRDQLRDALPRIPLKAAWRALIRHNRTRRPEQPRILSQADVERALAASPPDDFDPGGFKSALAVTDGAAIDGLLRWLPRITTEPVDVTITGWPPGFGPDLRARLLRRSLAEPTSSDAPSGAPLGPLPPGEAAAVRREFDGFDLGGHHLAVHVSLPPDRVLPGVPRHLRARPMRRDRGDPWLPNVDVGGRHFLTPEVLAVRQAGYVAAMGDSVLDGFCGVGGNAMAFARAGLRVIAVERDPQRLAMARRNAAAWDLDIEFRAGDLRDHLDAPADVLFLDPPWQRARGTPTWPALLDFVPPARPKLVLKLPRTFDLSTLPERSWAIHWEFGEGEDDRSIVRMISAVSP